MIFKPSGYIFEHDPAIQPIVYEVSILVLDNPMDRRPPADPLVAATVALIVGQFFLQYKRIIVYICDTSDQRGQIRQRKFTSWVNRFKGNDYSQLSDNITDEDGVVYATSLIVRRDNPYMRRILAAFAELITGNAK